MYVTESKIKQIACPVTISAQGFSDETYIFNQYWLG